MLALGAFAFAAAAAGGIGMFTEKVIRAARPRICPGATRELRREEVERPGRWAG